MRQFSLFVAILAALSPITAIGEWRAFSGEPYFHGATAMLSESTISIPSCDPIGYKLLKRLPSKQFGAVCGDYYFELSQSLACKQISANMLKPYILVTACPQTPSGNEELGIDMLTAPNYPKDNASKSHFGASWRLIRREYDPCDSGGGHGQWMCNKFAVEDAEDRLSSVWSTNNLADLPAWLKKRDRKCLQTNHTFSESWSYSSEEECKLRLTEKRIAQIKASSRSKRTK